MAVHHASSAAKKAASARVRAGGVKSVQPTISTYAMPMNEVDGVGVTGEA